MSENIIEQLTAQFIRFPGIGPKQARRFVYHLLKQDPQQLNRLAETIKTLRNNVIQCQACFGYFTGRPAAANGSNNLCAICLDHNRDRQSLMIVEKDVDLETVRKTDVYQGLFFVLGGLIPVMDKNPKQRIRVNELKNYLQKLKPQEVIIALAVNPDGDNTTDYLKKALAPIAAKLSIKISLLGRGLSTGTELEYSDQSTLDYALKNRQ